MAAKKLDSRYESKLSHYEKVIASNPEITRKGDRYAYTSHNGHMFSMLNPAGAMALRLPKDKRDAFLAKFRTTLFESHGAVMKEYVLVPDKLLQDTALLGTYLSMSLEYIRTLKPKPTKKKQSSKTAKRVGQKSSRS